MDATSGVALDLKTGVPTYQVEDEEGTTHLLIQLTIEEKRGQRWCLWRPDHAGFNSRSIFSSWHSRADHRNHPDRITDWVQDVRYHLIEVLDR